MRLILDTLEKILVRGGHLNDERTHQPEMLQICEQQYQIFRSEEAGEQGLSKSHG